MIFSFAFKRPFRGFAPPLHIARFVPTIAAIEGRNGMYLPVACLKCGKLFQVPAAAAGTEVPCPFCKRQTTALPVASPPAPLSLDDEEPPRVPRSGPTLIVIAAITVAIMFVVLGGTLLALSFGSGAISPQAWSEFTPPDQSCSIQLPGTPVEEHIEPSPADNITRGLNQYTTTGWFSRARVWFGWRDLDPAWVKQAQQDRDGAIINPVLTGERDRRKDQLSGAITKEATVRFGPNLGLEVWMDTPRGKLIERYIAAIDGPRPRLYFMGIESKSAKAGSPSTQKLFNSLRINKD